MRSGFLAEVFAQDHRPVVDGIVRAIEQRQRSGAARGEKRFPRAGVGVELSAVALPKVFPVVDVVPEPLSKFPRGSVEHTALSLAAMAPFLTAATMSTGDRRCNSAVDCLWRAPCAAWIAE